MAYELYCKRFVVYVFKFSILLKHGLTYSNNNGSFLQMVVLGTSGERYNHRSDSNGPEDVPFVVDRPMGSEGRK